MKKTVKVTLLSLFFLCLLGLAAIYMLNTDIAILNPKGIIALKEKKLLILASLLMLIVVVPVFIFVFAFAWKYRADNSKAKYTPNWADSHVAESIWWGVPFAIILIMAVITWKSSHELDPYKAIANGKPPLTLQVVALEWKWLFIYPEQKVASVNTVCFPVDTPIHFEITADAPMNSFWIPQLGGQIYAMPAMKTKLHLLAHEAGEYRGCSANLSGEGFAGMNFKAHVTSEEDFEKWVNKAKKTASTLSFKEYENLLKPSSYHPVILYNSVDPTLFDTIINKYNNIKKS